jgi:hypothetical protein
MTVLLGTRLEALAEMCGARAQKHQLMNLHTVRILFSSLFLSGFNTVIGCSRNEDFKV